MAHPRIPSTDAGRDVWPPLKCAKFIQSKDIKIYNSVASRAGPRQRLVHKHRMPSVRGSSVWQGHPGPSKSKA